MSTPAKKVDFKVPQIYLTDNAASKLHAFFLQEGKPDGKLRISIDGGGCSGFKYCFDIETVIHEDDRVFKKIINNDAEHYEVEVIIDALSFLYLQNAEIDYEENFQDQRFIIRNPNAQTTCGCGSSFSV